MLRRYTRARMQNDPKCRFTGGTVRVVPCFGAGLLVMFALCLTPAAKAQSAAATQAMAAQQQGNFAEAEKDWQAAVAENPQDGVAYANLGFVLAHQNKYGE